MFLTNTSFHDQDQQHSDKPRTHHFVVVNFANRSDHGIDRHCRRAVMKLADRVAGAPNCKPQTQPLTLLFFLSLIL